MTWIKVIPPDEADQQLKASYERATAPYPPEYGVDVAAVQGPDGKSDSIVATHSLIPQALRHAFGTHAALLAPDLPLSRRQHEMIATVVSALNRCFY
jgi:hypothetical protein